MSNVYAKELARLWMAAPKEEDGLSGEILTSIFCPWKYRGIHSLAFRFLIAIAPLSVPLTAMDRASEIWRLAIQMKRQLLETGKLIIWGEKWTWQKDTFAPQAVVLKRVRIPRKMFTF